MLQLLSLQCAVKIRLLMQTTILTLCMLVKNAADSILKYIFSEQSLFEMSKPIFWKKGKNQKFAIH